MKPEGETFNEKDVERSNMVTILAEATCSLLTSPVPVPAPTTHHLLTIPTWLELNFQALHNPRPLCDQVYGSEQGQDNVQVILPGGDREIIYYTEALNDGVIVNETLPDNLRPIPVVFPVVPGQFKPSKKSKKRRRKKKQEEDEPYVKKPLNAFMLFIKEHRKSVSPEICSKGNAAVNKNLGQKWKSLTKEEQAKYYSQAEVEQLTHYEKNPDWSSKQNYGRKKKRNRRRSAKKSHKALETPLVGSQGMAAAAVRGTEVMSPPHPQTTVMEPGHSQMTPLDVLVCDVFTLPERFTESPTAFLNMTLEANGEVAQIQVGVEHGLNTLTLPVQSQRDGFDPLEISAEGPSSWLDEVVADVLTSESLDQAEDTDFDPNSFLDMLFKDPVLSLDCDDMLMNF